MLTIFAPSEVWAIWPRRSDFEGLLTVIRSSLKRILLAHTLFTILFALLLVCANFYNFEAIVYSISCLFIIINLLFWLIFAKGLNSINSITRELANRAPNHLEPVTIRHAHKEIKPLIKELNKLLARLKDGFEREKRFAADAAHELRTPLAALKVHAQVALNSNDIDEKNTALEKLITGVNRGTHIVQQLLTMSKLFPDVIKRDDMEDTDLVKITREILAMHAPTAIDKKIQLEFDEGNHDFHLKGNSTALSILVNNLIDNSIRYCKENNFIYVRLYQQKNNIVLEVRDTGPGIPKALRPRVFERFFRVLGNKSPGSGLGLSIVKQICELHRGRVTLKSPKKGTGLIVSVFFPHASTH